MGGETGEGDHNGNDTKHTKFYFKIDQSNGNELKLEGNKAISLASVMKDDYVPKSQKVDSIRYKKSHHLPIILIQSQSEPVMQTSPNLSMFFKDSQIEESKQCQFTNHKKYL